MFSHVMIGVSDIEKSKEFYDAVFATLGLGPGVDSEYIKTVQIVSPSLSAFWKPVQILQSSSSD